MPSEWNALSSELRFLAVLALWILLSSFEFVSSWCMFFILDSISKTLNSPALRACEELINLMERGGLKVPQGFLMAALKGACSFLGLTQCLHLATYWRNVMTPWVHTFALLSHPSLGMSMLKVLVLGDLTLQEEKLLLKK